MSSEKKEKKKSKYFRDGSEPASKYIRAKGEKPTSKYIRKKDEEVNSDEKKDGTAKGEYRSSVLTPKRARETENSIRTEKLTTDELKQGEHINSKGSAVDMFSEGEIDEAQKTFYRREEAKKSSKHDSSQAKIRIVICLVLLSVVAVALQFLPFHIPYTPSFLTVEFSPLPELIASIAYGPLFGVAVCILKNLIHMAFVRSYIISDFNNILLNSTYVFIAGMLYSRSMFFGDKGVKHSKISRRRRIFRSGIIGALIAAVPQLLITRYLAYPLLERFYSDRGITMDYIFSLYLESYAAIRGFLPDAVNKLLPYMTGMLKGIAIFNLPITFIKLFIITTITALIYKYISPYLHYRETEKKKKKRKVHRHR